MGVQFSIYVAGSNPQLPTNFNHRVVMHFSADHGRPWTGGHSLVDRWLLISALDDYLRPHCMGSMICRNDMDIILLTLNYQGMRRIKIQILSSTYYNINELLNF